MSDAGGPTPPKQEPKPNGAEQVPIGTRGGGVFLGVMLVVLGAVVLVSQFVPGISAPWWALWPLIIIVAGVVQVFTPGSSGWGVDRVLDGLGTVIFGLILLGNTTGYVAWSVWWVVITLWPALVIALGLTILAKGLGQGWLRIVATLVVWITLAYAVALSWTGTGPVVLSRPWVSSGGQPFSYSEPDRGITDASLRLTGGAGDIRLGSGNQLVTVSGASPFGPPSFSAKKSGSSADVVVGFNESTKNVTISPGWSARASTHGSQTLRCGISHSRPALRRWTQISPTYRCATSN